MPLNIIGFESERDLDPILSFKLTTFLLLLRTNVMYWSEIGTSSIRRSNLDGSSVITVLDQGVSTTGQYMVLQAYCNIKLYQQMDLLWIGSMIRYISRMLV